MKILQVNVVYNFGSTGKIVHDIHMVLQNLGIQSIVCYGRGVRVKEPDIHKVSNELYSKFNSLSTRFTGIMYGGCYFSTNKLISIIKREKPDIVHLHCINGYFVNIYKLVSVLRDSGIKTVLTLHAEFMYTGNCGHALECEKWKTACGNCPRRRRETRSLFLDGTHTSWQLMKDAFAGFDENLIVVSVSPWLMERAKQSPILGDKRHCVVLNGIDTDIFHPCDSSELRAKHGIKNNEKIVFHATAHFSADPAHIKGGHYVFELAKLMKDQPVRFLIAGPYDRGITPPDNIAFLGRINDQKLLAQYYSMADVTVLTSKKETFSMICAESLCCGTPIVGFKAGAPEQIALPEYSTFTEYGDIVSLANSVRFWIEQEHKIMSISKVAESRYSIEKMSSGYIEIYSETFRK